MITITRNALMSVALLAATVSVANAADAGTGSVTFTGTINEGACSIAPADDHQAVPLGSIGVAVLDKGGISAPEPFILKLTGCKIGTTPKVQVTFTGNPAAGIPGAMAIVSPDGAGKAGVIMKTAAGAPVVLGTATAAQDLVAGDNDLHFTAALQGHPSDAATPGTFSAVTNFTLSYL